MAIAPAIKPAPDAAPTAIPTIAPVFNGAVVPAEAVGIEEEELESSASAFSLILVPFDIQSGLLSLVQSPPTSTSLVSVVAFACQRVQVSEFKSTMM